MYRDCLAPTLYRLIIPNTFLHWQHYLYRCLEKGRGQKPGTQLLFLTLVKIS